MFQGIMEGDKALLQCLGESFRVAGKDSLALLCFEHVFQEFPHFQDRPISEVTDTLRAFLDYARLMAKMARKSLDDPTVQSLFGFEPMPNNIFRIHPHTYFHQRLLAECLPTARVQDSGILLPRWELSTRFKTFLDELLWQRVDYQDNICRETRAFRVCLPFLLEGKCHFKDKCWEAHLTESALTPAFYNQRIYIHLKQVMILQTLHFNSKGKTNRQR
jgi:hypothetical protein